MAQSECSKKRAPSLWLKYNYTEPGDILMQDVFVPSCGLAKFTYYCCLNWNSGREGGGYCGIQDHPDGRAFIFSLWDPQQVQGVPITAVSKGPGTWTDRFGGEGTGLKSMNFDLGWKEDQWYTLVVRRWDSPSGHATHFGCWVHDQKAGVWTHLITMEYPVPQVYFQGTTVSFLEDWGFTSEHYRCAYYRNGFKRLRNESWKPFSNAEFEVNMLDVKNGTATTNFDATCFNPSDGICIAAGASLNPSTSTCCSFENQAQHPHPLKPPIKVQKVEMRDNVLTWTVDDSTTPQFGYRVKVVYSGGNGDYKMIGNGESTTRITFDDYKISEKERGRNTSIVVKLEDILGKCDERSIDLPH